MCTGTGGDVLSHAAGNTEAGWCDPGTDHRPVTHRHPARTDLHSAARPAHFYTRTALLLHTYTHTHTHTGNTHLHSSTCLMRRRTASFIAHPRPLISWPAAGVTVSPPRRASCPMLGGARRAAAAVPKRQSARGGGAEETRAVTPGSSSMQLITVRTGEVAQHAARRKLLILNTALDNTIFATNKTVKIV